MKELKSVVLLIFLGSSSFRHLVDIWYFSASKIYIRKWREVVTA